MLLKIKHLNECEEMNSSCSDMTKVRIVRLIFHRHEEYHDTIHKLHALQRRYTHIQEYPVQDGHWNELKDNQNIDH
jgi:hypothetical protein